MTRFALQINMLCLIVRATLNNDPIRLFFNYHEPTISAAFPPLFFFFSIFFWDNTVICISNVMFGGANLITNNST